MKLRFCLAAAVALVLALNQVSHAQTVVTPPGLIDYQGKVLDATGNALAPSTPTNYQMIFRIYTAQSGGSSIWTEQQTVTVSNGLFSVQLGAGSSYNSEPNNGGNGPGSCFSSTNGTGSLVSPNSRFVGVTVVIPPLTAATSGEIAPRLALLTTPFAYSASHAGTADSVNGVVNATTGSTFAGTVSAGPGSSFSGTVTAGAGSSFSGTATLSGTNTFTGATINGGTFAGGTFTGGTFSTGTFSGNGAGLTGFTAGQIPSLDASKIATGVLPVANGGTGSGTKNFVDLSNNQTVGGVKTFTSNVLLNTTGNPEYVLQVNGTEYFAAGVASANGNFSSSAGSGDVIIRSTQGTRLILQSGTGGAGPVIGSNNFVGIGTNTPGFPLHITNSANYFVSGSYGYLDQVAYGVANQTLTYPVSIVANQDVVASQFLAVSDARFKLIDGISDGAADLAALSAIKITDYHYKDVLEKGAGPQKKVIAQQVETVFPQAVMKTTDVIPDIFHKAAIDGDWVVLTTDLKVGDRVRLIDKEVHEVYEVLETKEDRFRTSYKSSAKDIFVYGREVKDCRSVDYEAIAMLNVSATQQIKKEKDAEIKSLQEANAALRAELAALEVRLTKLEQTPARTTPATASTASDGITTVALRAEH